MTPTTPGDAGIVPAPRAAGRSAVRGPAALRALAGAFAHLQDFDAFVHGLQAALGKADWLGHLTLELPAEAGDAERTFAPGVMTLPVQGSAGAHGLLRVGGRPGPRVFGAEDLHLLSSLADFLAAALDCSREWREVERHRELLSFLLNQAPVGILAFDRLRRVTAGNDLARRWLGGGNDPWGTLQAVLPPETGSGEAVAAQFHLRVEGRLVYGELRSPPGRDPAEVCVVVLADLSPDQARLLDALGREVYRCQWRQLALGLVILESPQVAGGVLQRLPELRAALPAGVAAGPYDANRVGLVFPECGHHAILANLRKLRPLVGDAVRAGLAELGRGATEPEPLLQAALGGLRPLAELLRPALLLHDDNPAVNDTLAYVLGGDFELVKSTSVEHTRQLLRSRSFDGLITEVDLRESSGLELARLAGDLQPGIRTFFTAISELAVDAVRAGRPDEAVVFRKPFDARALGSTVRAQLGL